MMHKHRPFFIPLENQSDKTSGVWGRPPTPGLNKSHQRRAVFRSRYASFPGQLTPSSGGHYGLAVTVNILRQQMRVHAEQLTLGTATMIHDLLQSYLKRVDMIIDPISLRGFLEKTLVLSLSLVMVRCAYPSPDGMTYFRHNQPTVSMEP